MKRRRGSTVIELLVAAGVLSLLGLLTVALFRTGASGWKKLEAQSGLLADYEVLSSKLTREVQRSVAGSVSIGAYPDGTTLSFLSAVDDTGTFVIDTSDDPGFSHDYKPVWQKYLIFNYDSNKREVTLNEVLLNAGSPQAKAPAPIETYDAGTGPKPLSSYRSGGRLLMKDVDACTFSLNNNILTLEVQGSRKRYGRIDPEKLQMKASANFRNNP